jgi:4'-phosphopantetheinyl transferase
VTPGAGAPAGTAIVTTERAARDRVDVWRAALDLSAGEAAAALRTLNEPERAHAARLRTGAPRWVAARAALRGVLARYLDVLPARVAFVTGAEGKPRLAPGPGADLRFNLSHSGGLALVAVRLGREVGVDLEELRDGVDGDAVAREFFDEPERARLAALAATGQPQAFFRAWVRREALAKASGRGISAPAARSEGARFGVRELGGFPGFAAAVASEGHGWSLRRRDVANRPR